MDTDDDRCFTEMQKQTHAHTIFFSSGLTHHTPFLLEAHPYFLKCIWSYATNQM